jgi:calcineurin-like phosphoesterase family protein
MADIEGGHVHDVRRPRLEVVCISDTHGRHDDVANLPVGDVLVHAGDWTRFGKREDAVAFNEFLGRLPHRHKIVVNGNHEANAEWKKEAKAMLSNATALLVNEACVVDGWHFYGTQFYWPAQGDNPYYGLIPANADVVIAHGPVAGYVDGGNGCASLRQHLETRAHPRLVVSGHIHHDHGVVVERSGPLAGTAFVNAANCNKGYTIGWGPITVTLEDGADVLTREVEPARKGPGGDAGGEGSSLYMCTLL